jgi:hypothetical protein
MRIVRSGRSDLLFRLAIDPHLWQKDPQESPDAVDYKAEHELNPVEMLDRIISRIQTSRSGGSKIELASIEEDLLALKGMMDLVEPPKPESKIQDEGIPF